MPADFVGDRTGAGRTGWKEDVREARADAVREDDVMVAVPREAVADRTVGRGKPGVDGPCAGSVQAGKPEQDVGRTSFAAVGKDQLVLPLDLEDQIAEDPLQARAAGLVKGDELVHGRGVLARDAESEGLDEVSRQGGRTVLFGEREEEARLLGTTPAGDGVGKDGVEELVAGRARVAQPEGKGADDGEAVQTPSLEPGRRSGIPADERRGVLGRPQRIRRGTEPCPRGEDREEERGAEGEREDGGAAGHGRWEG